MELNLIYFIAIMGHTYTVQPRKMNQHKKHVDATKLQHETYKRHIFSSNLLLKSIYFEFFFPNESFLVFILCFWLDVITIFEKKKKLIIGCTYRKRNQGKEDLRGSLLPYPLSSERWIWFLDYM